MFNSMTYGFKIFNKQAWSYHNKSVTQMALIKRKQTCFDPSVSLCSRLRTGLPWGTMQTIPFLILVPFVTLAKLKLLVGPLSGTLGVGDQQYMQRFEIGVAYPSLPIYYFCFIQRLYHLLAKKWLYHNDMWACFVTSNFKDKMECKILCASRDQSHT